MANDGCQEIPKNAIVAKVFHQIQAFTFFERLLFTSSSTNTDMLDTLKTNMLSFRLKGGGGPSLLASIPT